MNCLFIVFSLLVFTSPSFGYNEMSSGLCENPVIDTIDIFTNGSIRIYRDRNWWQLSGLPNRTGFISMNGTIDLQNMNEVNPDYSISTALTGAQKGITFGFRNNKIWSWDNSGTVLNLKVIPSFPITGFTAVFHNGNEDKPRFVCLSRETNDDKQMKVYYMKPARTNEEIPRSVTNGLTNYPKDIDAAFILFNSDPYENLYLFKGKQYCVRSITTPVRSEGLESCGQWRENRELFGCLSAQSEPAQSSVTDGKEYSLALFFAILLLQFLSF